jgi:hypothetical protein
VRDVGCGRGLLLAGVARSIAQLKCGSRATGTEEYANQLREPGFEVVKRRGSFITTFSLSLLFSHANRCSGSVNALRADSFQVSNDLDPYPMPV